MQPSAAIPHGAAPPGSRARVALSRGVDGVRRFLFGHDVFISYARADAVEYAQGLADALTRHRIAAYVDQLGTPPGPKMPPLLLLRLRLSSMLVLVASPGAALSEAVAQEVDEFTRRNHRVFVVDVAGALDGAEWYRDRIRGGPARRIQAAELASGTPSPAVVEQILKNVDFGRREDRLRRTMRYTLMGIAAIIAAGAGGVLVARARATALGERVRIATDSLVMVSRQADQARRSAGVALGRAETANRRAAGADSVRRVAEDSARAASLAAATALDSVAARRRTAQALYLANQASAAYDETSDGLQRSLLLAVESLREEWTVDGAARWLRAMALLPPRLGSVRAHAAGVTALALSPDGRRLASGAANGEIRLWEVREHAGSVTLAAAGTQSPARPDTTRPVLALAYSGDGRRLAAALGDSVAVWNAGAAAAPVFGKGLGRPVRAMAISPDGRSLAVTLANAYSFHLIDFAHATDDTLLSNTHRAPEALAFSADGRWLATGRGGVEIWDVVARKPVAEASGRSTSRPIRFSGEGTRLTAGAEEWDVARDSGGVRLSASGSSVSLAPWGSDVLAISRDRGYLVAALLGSTSIRNADAGRELSRIPSSATAADIDPGERWAVVGERDGTVSVWPTSPRNESVALPARGGAESLSFSPDGRWLATGAADGALRVFGVGGWRQAFSAASDGALARFSPDGRWLFAAGGRGARPYEAGSWRPRPSVSYEGEPDSVWMSLDGRWAVQTHHTCGHGMPLADTRVWEVATGRRLAWQREGCDVAYAPSPARAEGPAALVAAARRWTRIAVPSPRSRDGRWAASASLYDLTLTDAGTGRDVAGFLVHEGFVKDLAFSPDGNWLGTAGDDGVVRLWRLGPAAAMVEEACARLPRNLTAEEWRRAFGARPYRRTCPRLPDAPAADAT